MDKICLEKKISIFHRASTTSKNAVKIYTLRNKLLSIVRLCTPMSVVRTLDVLHAHREGRTSRPRVWQATAAEDMRCDIRPHNDRTGEATNQNEQWENQSQQKNQIQSNKKTRENCIYFQKFHNENTQEKHRKNSSTSTPVFLITSHARTTHWLLKC